jgi:uncharacterized protein YqcC (DUF446 family)
VQWLQWILLSRIRRILKRDLDLPAQSDIHSYAEEFLTDRREDTLQLPTLIKPFDELVA